ncbi:NAD(P)-dependent oxidoreductase [Catenuloplanes niger JCM 9533]
MAARCIGAGFEVSLWARRAASLEQFAPDSFRVAASLTDLGRGSDVVGVAVFSEDDVREVVAGDEGIAAGMAPGGIILIHSTVSGRLVQGLAEECGSRGVTVLDAPVSGLRARAVTGDLTIMVGGPEEAFETARPMLDAMASAVRRHGPVGAGLQVKVLNQSLLYANMAAAGLALEAADRLGLDRAVVADTILASSGASVGLQTFAGRVTNDPAFRDHAARTATKDLDALGSVLSAAGIDGGALSSMAAEFTEVVARLSPGRSAPVP